MRNSRRVDEPRDSRAGTGHLSRLGKNNAPAAHYPQVSLNGEPGLLVGKNTKKHVKNPFGCALEDHECEMDHGRRVPKLAVTLRRILVSSHALDHPGIFRESANHATLQLVKGRIVNGEAAEEVLQGCEPELVGCLFKVGAAVSFASHALVSMRGTW